MKKIISLLLAVFTVAAMAAFSASAADIYTSDDFSFEDETKWIYERPGCAFTVKDGKLEGWGDAVVLQSKFLGLDDTGTDQRGGIAYATYSSSMDVNRIEDDFDGKHLVSYWYAAYYIGEGEDRTDSQVTYFFTYNFDTAAVTISYDQVGEDGTIVASAQLDRAFDDGETFTMGFRVTAGTITGYINNQKLLTYSDPKIGIHNSPILFVNTGNHLTFDNFVAAPADYDLFHEGADTTNANTAGGDATGTVAPAVTEVIVTDDKGAAVTDAEGKVVTETVTVAVADTNKTNTSGGTLASQTGDTVAIVFAAMIVSLSTALIVKKVSAK